MIDLSDVSHGPSFLPTTRPADPWRLGPMFKPGAEPAPRW